MRGLVLVLGRGVKRELWPGGVLLSSAIKKMDHPRILIEAWSPGAPVRRQGTHASHPSGGLMFTNDGYALLIGVDDYGTFDDARRKAPGTSDLGGSRNDVRAFWGLCRPLGVKPVNNRAL